MIRQKSNTQWSGSPPVFKPSRKGVVTIFSLNLQSWISGHTQLICILPSTRLMSGEEKSEPDTNHGRDSQRSLSCGNKNEIKPQQFFNCSTTSSQVGLLESCDSWWRYNNRPTDVFFALCHFFFFFFIGRGPLEEDVSEQIVCFTKSLPPSFIHPVTNKGLFWINQQRRLIRCDKSNTESNHAAVF